jgi:hypothetical protein
MPQCAVCVLLVTADADVQAVAEPLGKSGQ